MELKEKLYQVTWAAPVYATTPQEAATKARKMQKYIPGVNLFTVRAAHGKAVEVEVRDPK